MIQKYSLIADGASLTNSTTETILGSYTIPANFFGSGKALAVRWAGNCPATNSTDTLTIRCRLGRSTLTGGVVASDTALFASAAVDAANNDIFGGQLQVIARGAAASSVAMIATGWGSNVGASPAPITVASAAASAVDTTLAQVLSITGTWSVANAGNSCRLIALDIFEVLQ